MHRKLFNWFAVTVTAILILAYVMILTEHPKILNPKTKGLQQTPTKDKHNTAILKKDVVNKLDYVVNKVARRPMTMDKYHSKQFQKRLDNLRNTCPIDNAKVTR